MLLGSIVVGVEAIAFSAIAGGSSVLMIRVVGPMRTGGNNRQCNDREKIG